MFSQVLELPFEPKGFGTVVGVEIGDVSGPAVLPGNVEGSGPAEASAPDDANPAVLFGSFEDRGGAVVGSVVDDRELEVGECLGQDAFDGLGDVLFAVVDRHDDVDARCRDSVCIPFHDHGLHAGFPAYGPGGP